MFRYATPTLLAGILASTAAAAEQPAYVGTWASDPKQCSRDQGMPDAPLILAARRYDQHEAHCTFGRVKKTGPATWQTRASCLVEGSKQKERFTLTVNGDVLRLADGAGARTLRRCR